MNRVRLAFVELGFTLLCFLACFGFWRSRGPRGRVVYRDGNISTPVPLGAAMDLAFKYDGHVIRPMALA